MCNVLTYTKSKVDILIVLAFLRYVYCIYRVSEKRNKYVYVIITKFKLCIINKKEKFDKQYVPHAGCV